MTLPSMNPAQYANDLYAVIWILGRHVDIMSPGPEDAELARVTHGPDEIV